MNERYIFDKLNELQSQLDQQDRVLDYIVKAIWRLKEKLHEYEELQSYLLPWMEAMEREFVRYNPTSHYEPYILGKKENPLTKLIEGRPNEVIDKR